MLAEAFDWLGRPLPPLVCLQYDVERLLPTADFIVNSGQDDLGSRVGRDDNVDLEILAGQRPLARYEAVGTKVRDLGGRNGRARLGLRSDQDALPARAEGRDAADLGVHKGGDGSERVL